MSIFAFDTEIPLAEYIRTITIYGEQYKPKPKTEEALMALAHGLKSSILSAYAKGQFDVAYYYCIEALQIFDPAKTGVTLRRSQPGVRALLTWLLDTTEKIKSGGLSKQYAERVAEIKAGEPERQKLLAQQLLVDGESDAQQQHNIRRQALLATRTADETQLLSALGQNYPNGAGGLRYGSDLGDVRTTTVTPPMPPAQYGSLYSSGDSNLQVVQPVAPFAGQSGGGGAPAAYRFSGPNSSGPGPLPRRGIVNLGNTCYMNSVIQVLNVTPLAMFFLSGEYTNDLVEKTGNYSRVVNAFSFVIRELHRKGCTFAVSPSSLKSAVGAVYEPFSNSKQQDANEFLRVVLDALHTGLNANAANRVNMPDIDNSTGTDDQLARAYWWQYAQRNASVVVDLCGFQERSMLTCPQCGHCSRSFFATLGIEVPVTPGSSTTLEKCLGEYCSEEILDNDSLYQCPGCRQKVNARKRLQLYSAPQILFITLKRFQHRGDFSNVAKVTSNVHFPSQLNLQPFMCSTFPSTGYDLVGVVNHQGNMHGGHYTSDACDSTSWFHASDEVVTSASKPNPSLAYILCYRRSA